MELGGLSLLLRARLREMVLGVQLLSLLVIQVILWGVLCQLAPAIRLQVELVVR
jgi:hypothetical protein